jgi:hypothetical protein
LKPSLANQSNNHYSRGHRGPDNQNARTALNRLAPIPRQYLCDHKDQTSSQLNNYPAEAEHLSNFQRKFEDVSPMAQQLAAE